MTPSQILQEHLRQQLQHDTWQLPSLQRWEKGVPLWGEIVYLSHPEAEHWQRQTSRLSRLEGSFAQQGIQLCGDSPELSRRLAIQINEAGYGGLVQFDNLTQEDCFLRLVVGESVYPVIVAQPLLRDFWMQLTLQACRHFLTVIDGGICQGFWESDVILRR
ncbi:MAG: hypothetical protein HC921_17155 [Synechococcaceae cyanobacterium SM2_3_1]|nr:hypothetical protein [Synechococcaceae cyanobacterium SM2_3_1]